MVLECQGLFHSTGGCCGISYLNIRTTHLVDHVALVVIVEEVAVLLVLPVLLAVEVPSQNGGEARLPELVVAVLQRPVIWMVEWRVW